LFFPFGGKGTRGKYPIIAEAQRLRYAYSVEPNTRARVSFMGVKCPYCHREIDNNFIRSEVAKQMGSVKSPRKKKDPKEMARIGKLGAKNRWAKHRAKEK
jgi:hypothetical protein